MNYLSLEFCYVHIDSVLNQDFNQKLQKLFSKHAGSVRNVISFDQAKSIMIELLNEEDTKTYISGTFDIDGNGQLDYKGNNNI